MLDCVYVVRLTLHAEDESCQRGWKMVGKKIVVIDIRCRNVRSMWKIKIAPYSWVASACPVFVLNETNVGENALISGRDIDETTKDACERAGVEMALRDNCV